MNASFRTIERTTKVRMESESHTLPRGVRMLVLSRKKGEKIRIGDNITIVVHRLNGNRVSLGIEAPPDCKIMRGELDPNDPPGGTPPQQTVSLPKKTEQKKAPLVRNGERRAAS